MYVKLIAGLALPLNKTDTNYIKAGSHEIFCVIKMNYK